MEQLRLHHYGYLTQDTQAWLEENELLLGKPFAVSATTPISTQKVNVTFVEQLQGQALIELIEPWEENRKLQKMLSNGVSVYHTGFVAAPGSFDQIVEALQEKGAHTLVPFASEAFGGLRCVFVVTRSTGLLEIIETVGSEQP